MTGDPTYADVAQWLPTDIREHIEATTPCTGGYPHTWRHEPGVEMSQWGRLETFLVGEHWTCRRCRLAHTTDPTTRDTSAAPRSHAHRGEL